MQIKAGEWPEKTVLLIGYAEDAEEQVATDLTEINSPWMQRVWRACDLVSLLASPTRAYAYTEWLTHDGRYGLFASPFSLDKVDKARDLVAQGIAVITEANIDFQSAFNVLLKRYRFLYRQRDKLRVTIQNDLDCIWADAVKQMDEEFSGNHG